MYQTQGNLNNILIHEMGDSATVTYDPKVVITR